MEQDLSANAAKDIAKQAVANPNQPNVHELNNLILNERYNERHKLIPVVVEPNQVWDHRRTNPVDDEDTADHLREVSKSVYRQAAKINPHSLKRQIGTCMDHTRPSLAIGIESIKRSFADV